MLPLTHDWKKLRVEPSFSYYHYYRRPTQFPLPQTGEAAVRVSHAIGQVRVFTNQIFDVVHYRGGYFGQAGAMYERGVHKRLLLSTTVAVGWASAKFNQSYIGVRKRAVNEAEAQVALTYAVNRRLYLRPHF
ncbi:MAG: hypothetical protein U0Y68_22970 [Blastocatellia bacterium]